LVVHNHKYFVEIDIIRYNYVEQLCGKDVSFHSGKLSHDLNFSDYFFESVRRAEQVFDEFDGDHLLGHLVLCLDDLAEGATPNCLNHLVGVFYI